MKALWFPPAHDIPLSYRLDLKWRWFATSINLAHKVYASTARIGSIIVRQPLHTANRDLQHRLEAQHVSPVIVITPQGRASLKKPAVSPLCRMAATVRMGGSGLAHRRDGRVNKPCGPCIPHQARPTRRSSPLEPRTLLPPAPTTEPRSSFDSRLFDTATQTPCEERYVEFHCFFWRLQSLV
jgi:hypothetical protein